MLASRCATCKRFTMVQSSRPDAGRPRIAIDLLCTSLAIGAGLSVLVAVLQNTVSLSDGFSGKLLATTLPGGLLVLAMAMRKLPATTFGPANRVTLVRGAMVALLFALIGETPVPWLVVVVVSVAMALDGVDGWLARRYEVASAFGARFDMETDALLLLVLSILVWQYDKAGPWIVLAGAMRYLFVALGYLMPWLRQPLPPKRRRQTAFVTQAIILIVCVLPLIPPLLSSVLAFAGLAILSWSFALDFIYLAKRGS